MKVRIPRMKAELPKGSENIRMLRQENMRRLAKKKYMPKKEKRILEFQLDWKGKKKYKKLKLPV